MMDLECPHLLVYPLNVDPEREEGTLPSQGLKLSHLKNGDKTPGLASFIG